jgi:hypothetical protein
MSSPQIHRTLLGFCLAASTMAAGATAADRDDRAQGNSASAIANINDDNVRSQSLANSDSPSPPERDTGLDRPRDPMSREGLKHSQTQNRDSDHDADDQTATAGTDDSRTLTDLDRDQDHSNAGQDRH